MENSVKRSPLALVIVAFVVTLMLYVGYHKARGAGLTSHLTTSSVAPDFTLESLDGKSLRLSDLRGKAVLLNFWATWCGPCKIEMPWFVDFQKQYGSQGLQIVGVAMDDASKADIAKFAKDMGVNYPILIGKESVGDQYGGVPALPESFVRCWPSRKRTRRHWRHRAARSAVPAWRARRPLRQRRAPTGPPAPRRPRSSSMVSH